MADKIEIAIKADVFETMFKYASYAEKIYSSEISGWAHCKGSGGIYKLAPLPEQIVTGGDVETPATEIFSDPNYDISDLIVQWHSHVNMSTFYSQVDKENIRDVVKLTKTLISIVVNCKGEYTARLDSFIVGRVGLEKVVTFDVELKPYYDNQEIADEVRKKLTKKVYIPATTSGNMVMTGGWKFINDGKEKFIENPAVQTGFSASGGTSNVSTQNNNTGKQGKSKKQKKQKEEEKKIIPATELTPAIAFQIIYEKATVLAVNDDEQVMELKRFKNGIYLQSKDRTMSRFIHNTGTQSPKEMIESWNYFIESFGEKYSVYMIQ